jgi:4-hydroxy-3-methylbut-2-enyl diphosphate reductase IspH
VRNMVVMLRGHRRGEEVEGVEGGHPSNATLIVQILCTFRGI